MMSKLYAGRGKHNLDVKHEVNSGYLLNWVITIGQQRLARIFKEKNCRLRFMGGSWP